MPSRYEVIQLKPWLYLLDDSHQATAYLVIGSERACVIDTTYGVEDLHAAVSALTYKPLVVVNTHGHPDHIWGNIYFDNACLNPVDFDLAETFIRDPEFVKQCEAAGRTMPPFTPIREGDEIDLGGKTLVVYDLPGHTPGGILLLLKEDRILFTGDSVNHHLWMQLDCSLSIEKTIPAFDRILFLEKEADVILHGHARGFDDISLLRCVRDGLASLAAGDTAKDIPYHWFGGEDMQHPFPVIAGKQYQQDDHVICYRESNIH